jgi:peptidoglycan/xylan/chitin deacetylase (PgdA/CDA1 family)
VAGQTDGLPKKPVVITFDDGYADNITHALPLLKQYGFTAILYLVTGETENTWDQRDHNENPKLLATSDQIKTWLKAGCCLGYHTHHHDDISDVSNLFIRSDFYDCHQHFDSIYGVQPNSFAYPYGRHSFDCIQFMPEMGMKFSLTTQFGFVKPGDRPHRLNRMPVRHTTHLFKFAYRLSRVEGWGALLKRLWRYFGVRVRG